MPIQKIVIRQYTVEQHQPQPLLSVQHPSNKKFAEFAGGTTAECAAVCCCFPLSLVNILVLTLYGVPAGLYRKALRQKRRRKLLKKRNSLASDDGDGGGDRSCSDGSELLCYDPSEMWIDSTESFPARFLMKPMGDVMEVDSDVIRLENEMWDKFYGTGFWRSGSQRVE
ncbi:uncharacterized protein [Rutidosis leptorrhynchoides]|uniref:uncharacterized protein n=1 Tax=Rutidosis leptorrhynchoides TaxID=125765 RepID=UPI003A9A2E5F